jgi:hypothetical protein
MVDGRWDAPPARGVGIRVADLLAWDTPRVELVGSAVGLDRTIRWSLSSDLLDPSPYMRGGELLLTAGISITDAAAQRAFVDAVVAAGASAIGFALGVVADEVPNAAGIAVLSIPADVAFVEITQRLAVEQSRHELDSRESARVGALVDMVRRGQASPQVLRPEFGADPVGAVHVIVTRGVVGALRDHGVWGSSGEGAVGLVPLSELEDLGTALEGMGDSLGWSGPVALEHVANALREAHAAAAVSVRLGRATGPQDLATWHGLVHRLRPDQLAPFLDHVIAPLREYDRRHRTQLLRTADVLCRRDGAVHAAAEELYVHENTIRKRVIRIEQITGLNPLRSLDRAAFLVGLSAES